MLVNREKKVGLALGSGVARGFAHIGALEVFEEENIQIDMLAGTSAGALIGALYAMGLNVGKIKEIATDIDFADMVKMIDIRSPRTGFITGNKVKRFIHNIIGDAHFTDTKTPFACIATDIITGEEVVIKDGLIIDAVRASISIPGIFKVAKWQDRYLVDGRIVNPVPVDVVRNMGADVVIAVNVMPLSVNQSKKIKRAPGLFQVLINTIEISTINTLVNSLEQADVIINVDTKDFNQFDFKHIGEIIKRGIIATEKTMPEIINALK